MKPYGDRVPDGQYGRLVRDVLEHGTVVKPIQGEEARMLSGYELRYNIYEGGYPSITERNVSYNLFPGAMAELTAFLNGATTDAELKAFGCKWWPRWVTEEKCAKFGLEQGNLGPVSYGGVFRNFPHHEGGSFDQVSSLFAQMSAPELQSLRTHILTPFATSGIHINPESTKAKRKAKNEGKLGPNRAVVVAPCHGFCHFHLNPRTKELVLVHFQRSGDVLVGLPINIMQYAALGLMAAQILGYRMTELVYYISDAHIYKSQYAMAEDLAKLKPMPFPSFWIDGRVKNILSFRPRHLRIGSDYLAHGKRRFTTPV